jgi:hypothetical protein
MKRYLFLLLCFFQLQFSSAQSVDDTQARKAAIHFIMTQKSNSYYSITSVQQILSDDGVMLSYLFSLSPQGYIAVSADLSFYPIVAYSFVGCDSQFDNGNPLILLIKKDYSDRLQNKSKLSENFVEKNHSIWLSLCSNDHPTSKDTTFQQWPEAGSTTTGGWVITKWNQSSPYNSMCPMDLNAGSRSYTGCPATAMAQIINYHRSLNGTRFSDADDYYHNYGSNQFSIDDDYVAYGFPSFPQLNLYLDTLESKYGSNASLTNNDKAALSFACGVATKSVYGASGSGTFSVNQAYDGLVRMGYTTCQLLDTSVSDPLPQVIANIKDSMPALLAVVDQAWSTGHNLVIDGYNTDDFFHLNFGWGGSNDGWYNIPSGMPYNLTVFEGIIVNIKPADASGIKIIKENEAAFSIFPNPADDFAQLSLKPAHSGIFRIVLYDALGSPVSDRKIQADAGKNYQVKISLENISRGIYSYKVTGAYESWSGKLIKL